MRASAARRSSDTPDDHVERDKAGADVPVLCLTSAPPFEQQPMDREAELEIVRRAYAKRVMFVAGVHDRRVEAAFASVPRERFLGRGPWPILHWDRGPRGSGAFAHHGLFFER